MKFSQIAAAGANLASTDFLMGVQSGTTDALFTPAQVGNGIPASAPLTGTGATITANTPLINISQTWNNAAVAFQGAYLNITNTASAAASKVIDVQIGGASALSMNTDGNVLINAPTSAVTTIPFSVQYQGSAYFAVSSGAAGNVQCFRNLSFVGSYGINFSSQGFLIGEETNAIAQRNGAIAQCQRVYNTFTDSSNYERGVFDWTTTANTLTIGTQAAGTGTARDITLAPASGGINFTHASEPYMNWYIGGTFNFTIDSTSSRTVIQTRSSSHLDLGIGGSAQLRVNTNWSLQLDSQWTLGWGSGAVTAGNADTGISRSAAGVIAIGNGTAGDSSACILAKTKAGAPVAADVPASTWVLIRDTTNATTKIYYNNAGTLMSVALV